MKVSRVHLLQRDLRAVFVRSFCQLRQVVDTEANVWIRSSATNLARLDIARVVYSNFDDANRRVYRSPGKELFEIEGKHVGVIHHGAKDRVDHVANEGRQTGDLHKKVRPARKYHKAKVVARTYVPYVKAEGFTPYGLENIVDDRLFEETYIHDLDVGEAAHKFKSNA